MTTLDVFQSECLFSVYQCIAADGTVLYVGYTSRGSGRLADHVGKPWWYATETIFVMHQETAAEARAYEAHLIREYRPLFNGAGRPKGVPVQVITPSDALHEMDFLRAEVERLRDALARYEEHAP